jgi:hypothetical protein
MRKKVEQTSRESITEISEQFQIHLERGFGIENINFPVLR